MNLVALITAPPRLAVRLLDDVHALARTATTIGGQVERLIDLGERLDSRGQGLIALGERLDSQGGAIVELGDEIINQGNAIVAQGDVIQSRAQDVSARAGELIEALPMLERAIGLAMPLEGAVERLGRVADRLPGGRGIAGQIPRKPRS